MSSCTEMTITPTYKVTTRQSANGVEILDLTKMLGAGGCALVSQTLETMAQVPGCDWRRVSGATGNSFELDLRAGLPSGVESVLVAVHFRRGAAEVSRRWTYQTAEITTQARGLGRAVPAAVAEGVRTSVNRALNGVIMQTVANHLRARVEQRVLVQQRNRIQQTVQIRQRATNQIQMLARMRVGSAR